MQMPEAAVNKNRLSLRLENQIRASGQIFSMKAVTVAHAKYKASYGYLRAGITRANQAHADASSGRRHCVHWLTSFWLASSFRDPFSGLLLSSKILLLER